MTSTLALLLAVAAALRVWGLGFGLPFGNARPDETYIMDVVRPLLQGQAPPPSYEYPWLYMGLTAIGWIGYFLVGAAVGTFQSVADMLASWRTHYEPFFLINRGISAVMGTLTVAIVFAIARRLWDARTALVAAALLAVAYLHVRDSHYGTTDVPMTFFVMLAVLLLFRAQGSERLGGYAWAGVAAGLAGATKYSAVFVVVPAIFAAAVHARRLTGRPVIAMASRLAAFAAPCGVVAALGIPFAATDPAGFARSLQLLFTSTTSGHQHLDLDIGWFTHLEYSLRYGVGWPLLAAAVFGTAAMAVRQPAQAAVLLAFPLSYFALVGAARNQYFRYVVPLVPFLCLGAAAAVRDAVEALRRAGVDGSRPAAAMAIALTAALAAEPAARCWRFDRRWPPWTTAWSPPTGLPSAWLRAARCSSPARTTAIRGCQSIGVTGSGPGIGGSIATGRPKTTPTGRSGSCGRNTPLSADRPVIHEWLLTATSSPGGSTHCGRRSAGRTFD